MKYEYQETRPMGTHYNSYSNLWSESLNRMHHTWKNQETQSLTNQVLEDEKKNNHTNDLK